MENLSEKELTAINGGGLFDGNTGTMAISLTATTDSLLSISFTRVDGDYKSTTTLSAGNNIGLNLGLLGQMK
ncbi:bacteriocin [Pedobacter sp. 22226]|uniref:bacteriocin n=1 Tax=Pedobacter sp. 22226 TaxID=3453894 RepID=UPI003F863399